MWKNSDKRGVTNDFPSSNPNDQDQVVLTTIPINPSLSLLINVTPNQNAQKYFKRYQKLKRGIKYLTELIETKATVLYLEKRRNCSKLARWGAEIREKLFKQALLEDVNEENRSEKPESIWLVRAVKPLSLDEITERRIDL